MQARLSLTLAVATALLIAACSSPAATPAPTPPPATTAPATTAPETTAPETTAPETTAPETEAPETEAPETEAPETEAPTSDWVVGVVTDVGTVDDKNFNEYSYNGAVAGAADIGAPEVSVAVPDDASQYASLIQNFIDTDHNIIVTVGFNLTNDTAIAATENPDVWFIGVDQAPCFNADGTPNPAGFPCEGDAAEFAPNFVGLQYKEDQAGYLAGIVAASISENGTIGAIGGINLVPAVVRYLQGYELGAQSVNPEINVVSDYVSTSDFGVAFNDPAAGKTFAEQFIATNEPDVLFQVAGKTGNGVLEAACENDLHGIGVDVDQWLSLSADTDPTYDCIVTSAEKHLATSVQDTINQIADGTVAPVGGVLVFDATNDGIGLSPENSGAGLITAEVQGLIDAALAGMQDGSVVTCPETCGTAQ